MLEKFYILAYIDPNTTQHIFGIFGYVLAALVAVAGVLIWPFRYFLRMAWKRYCTLSWAIRIAAIATLLVLFIGIGWGVYALIADRDMEITTSQTLQNYKRVIVLGMDGLDPRIMEEMMAMGKLPHFNKLAASNGYARLRTSNPPESPVAWSTIATGCNPGEHGIFDFLHRWPKTYTPYLSLRNSKIGPFGTKYQKARRRDGFWIHTSKKGIPTTVIRWPVAFPAEKVNGRFLSGFGVPDLVGSEGGYVHYTSAPVAEDDPGMQFVQKVSWDGQTTQTELRGPAIKKNKYASLQIFITRSGENNVTLDVEGADPIEAVVGEWTAWVPVRFAIGLTKVHGAVKFMLTEVKPYLNLTQSPIHMDPANQAFPFTYPSSFGAELKERLGFFHTLGMPEQVHPLSHRRYGYKAFIAECEAIGQERLKMFEAELDRFDQGLLAFVFDTSDRIQHAFWSMRDKSHPAHDPDEAIRFSDVIPDMYQKMDTILEQVLEKIDSETLLIVLSDHGFSNFRRAVHVNRWLIENGYMNLSKGNDQEGGEIFESVDWSRTKAYAMGFTSVYLNLSGREGAGIVPPDQVQSLCEEIVAKLRIWKDEDGTAILHNIYIASDIYKGPALDDGPDLVLGYKPGYRASWQTALGSAPRLLVEDNTKRWSGDHLIDPEFVPGVLFSNHRIESDSPQLIDIAPTVLKAFGISLPAYMVGKPLF